MSKLEQIKKILFAKEEDVKQEAEVVKFEIVTLDDGVSKVEAAKFEAGELITIVGEDDQRTPLPVGSYGMEDGREIVVAEEGIIEQIREKQSEEVQEEASEEMAASDSAEVTPVAKKVVDSVVKETYFSKEEMDAKDLKIKELEAQILELSKVEPKGITHNPEPKQEKESFVIGANGDKSRMNRVFELINNNK